MVEINVYRHQYGVGQGNFHIQELVFSGSGINETTHRFVYDCGGYLKTVDWCIKHAAPGPARLEVDAVYLSHFESDHINGLTTLCANADVGRIYAPHIDKAQAAHILAMQISNEGGWNIELQSFVSTVVAVASGGPVNGVPVTQIRGGDSRPGPQAEQLTEPLTDFNREQQITVRAPTGSVETHAERVIISSPGGPTAARVELWEMVHWYYAAHSNITTGILDALRADFPEFKMDVEPGLEVNASLAAAAVTLIWMQKHFKAIAATYKKVMKAHNVARLANGDPPIADNHNVASLCLYSGPVPVYDRPVQYMSRPQPSAYWYSARSRFYIRPYLDLPHHRTAWLGTGDAMLKDPQVWGEFESHFNNTRLDGCLTVQVPHHGADAPSSNNYNPKLIRRYQNCVISAGANSKHGHPHKNVVKDILAKPAMLQLVNENDPIGFVEHIKFQRK